MHEALRRYWPPERQILLLASALADLETARRAWSQWSAGKELAEATSPEVRLLAAVAQRMPELVPGATPDPRLGGARRYIWTQTQMTIGSARPLLAEMHAAGVRMMLMKGAARIALNPALAQERALRDVDVLVHPDDWATGLDFAMQRGWTYEGADRGKSLSNVHAVGLRRATDSGAPAIFDLHRFVLYECRNRNQDLGFWERAIPTEFQGIDLLCPSMTDQALVMLAQSMLYSAAPHAPLWALDVDPMVRAGSIDWDLFLREVHTRQIQMYVAAPLLLLNERTRCPVPAEVMRDLTRYIGKAHIIEFDTRATGYGPRLPEQFDAVRTLAVARAMRAARSRPVAVVNEVASPSPPARRARLGPQERMEIAVPKGEPPFKRMRLEIEFQVWAAKGHAYLKVDAPGLRLLLVPIPRASRKRGGQVRRSVVLLAPACLFTMRDIDVVRLCPNDRLEIRDVTMRWGPPPRVNRLGRTVAAVRSWWHAR
jgi:Uncharacterised nucleotidyltransferase